MTGPNAEDANDSETRAAMARSRSGRRSAVMKSREKVGLLDRSPPEHPHERTSAAYERISAASFYTQQGCTSPVGKTGVPAG